MRRHEIGRLLAAGLLSVALIAFAAWCHASWRLSAAAAWIAGLSILWFAAPAEARPPSSMQRHLVGPPLSRATEQIALIAVLVVALAFRFLLLAQVPPFISNDESMFSFETGWRPDHSDLYGLSLISSWPAGWFPYLFGIGWNSFPYLSSVIHWLPVLFLGVSNWSLRVGCAVVGTLSIFVLYLWARRWWGNVVGLCAALALSLNIEHIYWSRIALNNIDAALVAAWVLAALAWTLDTRSWRAWIMLGFALGFGFHTYHGANLHLPLVVLIVLALWLGGSEPFSRMDLGGVLLAALAAALVVLPLVPDVAAQWSRWYVDHAGRSDVPAFIGMLRSGDTVAAATFVKSHVSETARLFQPAPVMGGLFLLGSALAVWHLKDPRYFTAVVWLGTILVVGSTTVGWRSARLVGALPVMSLMPALVVAHSRACLLRWGAPSTLRRVLTGVACLLVVAVLYEAWSVEFVWRVQFRNVTFGLCRAIHRAGLPATIYVAGTGNPFTPEQALNVCSTPPDPRRHFVTLSAQLDMLLDEIGDDPNVMAIIFADRPDVLRTIRQRYPAAIEEPYVVNGPDPFAGGWPVPGTPAAQPGTLAFSVVWLRSSCPVAPLLQAYDPCVRGRW